MLAGGAGTEQELQAEAATAYFGAQPLSSYRPSEDQLEKLNLHMSRQAALGEVPWPLAGQGGLKGILASHQVNCLCSFLVVESILIVGSLLWCTGKEHSRAKLLVSDTVACLFLAHSPPKGCRASPRIACKQICAAGDASCKAAADAAAAAATPPSAANATATAASAAAEAWACVRAAAGRVWLCCSSWTHGASPQATSSLASQPRPQPSEPGLFHDIQRSREAGHWSAGSAMALVGSLPAQCHQACGCASCRPCLSLQSLAALTSLSSSNCACGLRTRTGAWACVQAQGSS